MRISCDTGVGMVTSTVRDKCKTAREGDDITVNSELKCKFPDIRVRPG